MSVFKGGGNKSSINRNFGKSLVGRGINIPFSELSSQEVTEISEGITTGSIGNNASGGLTDDQDIEDSDIAGSIINNTTIGLTTASNANFTNVNILNTTPSTSSTTGAFVVSGGIGVAKNSYFGDELHASEFHGCGRNITSILGENVIGNVSAEPNYLIIKVGQHCVSPPNIAPNINAVGIGSGHWLFGYNSLIAGGKNSNNYSRLSAIVAGNSQAIYNGGNLSIILGGENNKISGEYSGVLSSISSNITGKSSLALGGNNNLVTGNNSTAIGSNISISHNGSTLISDNQSSTYSSDANNQFKVRASGGSTFNSSLSVSGATSLNSSLSVTGTSTLTGEVSINSVTDSSSPSIGALTVSGGIGVTKDLRVGNDISLQSNDAVLNFGLSSDVNLTHIPSTGIRMNDAMKLEFRDSAIHVSSDADGYLNLQADTGVHINVNGTDEILVTATETTLTGNLLIPDGGLIGSSSDQDAISISSGGVVGISAVTESSSTTTGSLTVAGGVGISKDLYVGDDLFLNSDDTVLNFGADSNVNLTHIPDTGLRLNDSRQIQFRDSAVHISSDADGYLNLQADTGVNINIGGADEISVTATESTFGGNLVIPNGGLIGSSSDQDAISISSGGVVGISTVTESSSTTTGALTVAGGVGISKDLYLGDDLFLNSDDTVLNFGADSNVNLTHIPDTGLRLNDSRQIQFRDSAVHVSSDADGYLNLQADTGINLNINGTDKLAITSDNVAFGGNINLSSTTESTSITTGALTVAGGVGISKDLYVGDDLFLNSDDTVLNFGADSDVNLTHIHDTGLRLNESRQIQFRDSAIHVSSDAVGYLNLQANTGVNINVNGTDEILVTANETTLTGNLVIPDGGLIGSSSDQDAISISAAGVVGISTVTESSSTTTGALTVAGGVGISKDLYLGDDLFLNSDDTVLNFGANSDVNLTHIPDTGLRLNESRQIQFRDSAVHVSSDADGYLNLQADTGVNLNINGSDQIAITSTKATFSGNIEIPDDYFIGSAWFSNAISISGTGNINLNSITESTSSTTGALTIKGGVGIGKDLYVGDDLFLNSDDTVLNFGANSDVNLTHIHDTGLRLNESRQIQFRDSAVHVSSDADGYLNLQADTGVNININGSDQIAITNNESTFSGNIVIPDGSLIGSSSDKDAVSISSNGVVSLSSITESSSITTGALTVAGGVGISKDLNIGDDLSLKSNGAILNFGESDDVNLTHVPSSGLLLNDSNKIQFRNSDVHISSDAAGYMNLQASNTVNININNTDEISVTSTESTFGGNLVMPDGGNFGSTSDPDAISISNTGVVTLSSNTQSSSSITGALTVAGGVGISKKLHVAGISTFEQEIKANSTITGFKNMRLGSNHNCEIETSSILGASNSNVSTGNYSAIVAGNNHQLSSNNSIILNGDNNNNQADYSICSGYGSKTVKQGQISHAMGFFTDVGDSQFSNFIFRRNITHVSGTTYKIGINNLEPTVSSEASISIDNNSMFSYYFNLTGISTTNNKFWNFILKGVVYRNSSGTYSHIKGTKEIIVKNKLSDDANIEVDATHGIYLIIKINSNYTVQWVSSLQAVENKL